MLNLIDGRINVHCPVLNSEERWTLIWQANEVAAVMTDLENDKAEEKF